MSEGFIDTLWYLARGTGVVSLVLLTTSLVLGIGSRSGRPAFGLPRFAVALVHRNASLIAIGLVLIHVTSLFFDPYAQLRLVDLIVPFGATYRPLWVGFGTLAAELLILVVASSLLRQRIGVGAWRGIHWTSYALWPLAWLHGFYSGSDAGSLWLRLVVIACALAVGAAGVWRFLPQFAEGADIRVQPPRGGPALAGLAGLVTAVRQRATRSGPSTRRERPERPERPTRPAAAEAAPAGRPRRSTTTSTTSIAPPTKWRTTPPITQAADDDPRWHSTPTGAGPALPPDTEPAWHSTPTSGGGRRSAPPDPEPAWHSTSGGGPGRRSVPTDPEPSWHGAPTSGGGPGLRSVPTDPDPSWHSPTSSGGRRRLHSVPDPEPEPSWRSTPTSDGRRGRHSSPADDGDTGWHAPPDPEPAWGPAPEPEPAWDAATPDPQPPWRRGMPADTDPRWRSAPPDPDTTWRGHSR